jgi:hypothetical protein
MKRVMNSLISKNAIEFLKCISNLFTVSILTNYSADVNRRELQEDRLYVLKSLEFTRPFSMHECRHERLELTSQIKTNFLI